MISAAIQQLVNYGLDTGLILPEDEIYIRNQLLMTLQLDDFTEPEGAICYTDLESILTVLVDDAVARGVCEDNSTARDLFDTKLMGVLTPRPSIVRANFEECYETEGPQAATDWFYQFSQNTDYIRRYRVCKDMKWVTKTSYGDLDITINLSKPEKDPKAIAAAKLAPQSAYPKCQLCIENEGYAGRMASPTTPLPPSPVCGRGGSNWIWCCATTSPPQSIRWACIIPTQSCTTSRRKTLV